MTHLSLYVSSPEMGKKGAETVSTAGQRAQEIQRKSILVNTLDKRVFF